MPAAPSPAQQAASRANGARSRGPVTGAGKVRASRNGTRHGLRGGPFALLPGEDADEFAELHAAVTADWSPRDAYERRWVRELVAALWRQERLRGLELATPAAAEEEEPAHRGDREAAPDIHPLRRADRQGHDHGLPCACSATAPTTASPKRRKAQQAASRANGARSRGPATDAGRTRAARNGTRHGLRGGPFALLPGEDADEFAAAARGGDGRLVAARRL